MFSSFTWTDKQVWNTALVWCGEMSTGSTSVKGNLAVSIMSRNACALCPRIPPEGSFPIEILALVREKTPRQISSIALYTRLHACTDQSPWNNPTILCKVNEWLRHGYNLPRCWKGQGQAEAEAETEADSSLSAVLISQTPTVRWTVCGVPILPKLHIYMEFSGK